MTIFFIAFVLLEVAAQILDLNLVSIRFNNFVEEGFEFTASLAFLFLAISTLLVHHKSNQALE